MNLLTMIPFEIRVFIKEMFIRMLKLKISKCLVFRPIPFQTWKFSKFYPNSVVMYLVFPMRKD